MKKLICISEKNESIFRSLELPNNYFCWVYSNAVPYPIVYNPQKSVRILPLQSLSNRIEFVELSEIGYYGFKNAVPVLI